jgi:hypothetical protein
MLSWLPQSVANKLSLLTLAVRAISAPGPVALSLLARARREWLTARQLWSAASRVARADHFTIMQYFG